MVVDQFVGYTTEYIGEYHTTKGRYLDLLVGFELPFGVIKRGQLENTRTKWGFITGEMICKLLKNSAAMWLMTPEAIIISKL